MVPPSHTHNSKSAPPPQNQQGEGQESPVGDGTGGANLDDRTESLALCILCGLNNI